MSTSRFTVILMTLLFANLIVGCDMSRFEPVEKPVHKKDDPGIPIPAGSGDPVTLYRCVVWNSDNVGRASIPLETEKPVDAVSEGGYFTFSQTTSVDGKSFLVPQFKEGAKIPELGYDNVYVFSKDSTYLTQKVRVILRPSEMEKLSPSSTTNTDERMSFIFSHAVNPNVDAVGAIKVYPVLQEGAIKSHITIDNDHGQYTSQEHGSSIKDVQESHNYSFGLGGTFLSLFAGNIGGSMKKTTHNRTEYEYIMGTKMFYASQGALRWNDIDPLLCIDKSFNDLINNPGSAIYKKYEDTEEGIFELLRDYGSSIVCTASLGAYGEYVYSRKKSISEQSIAWDLKVGLEMSKKAAGRDTSVFSYLRALQTLGVKVNTDLDKLSPPKSKKFSGEFSTEHDYKKYLETVKTNVDVFVCGGNSLTVNVTNDLSPFNATEDCSKWIICSYLYHMSDKDIQSNPNPFRSVSTLVYDTTSVRGKIICDLLKPYTKDNRQSCKFYDMFEQPKKQEPSEVVLADFRCVLSTKANGIYPNVGTPEPMIMTGPDGKERLYYATMTGPWTPNIEQLYMQGYVFDASFNESNKKKYNVNFYYALDYSDECYGLTDIRVLRKDMVPQGFVRHPEDICKGETNGSRFIGVKPGNADTPDKEKIRAVGIYNDEVYVSDDEKKTRSYPNAILTATGGAEIPINYTVGEINDIRRIWNGTEKEVEEYIVPYSQLEEPKIIKSIKTCFENKFEDGKPVVRFYCTDDVDENNNILSDNVIGKGIGERTPVMSLCWTKLPITKRVSVSYMDFGIPGYYASEIHHPLIWEADMN